MKLRTLFIVLYFSASISAGVVVHNADYHGLKAITLRNHTSLVIVVPKTGRILSFQLCDYKKCEENPIWNNPQLGAGLKPDDEGWTNYGGDKSWPAPQSDWPKITGKGWPPPTGYDHMPFVASTKGSTLTLTSPVDPSYGIRVRRVISLDDRKPILRVTTTYEKITGAEVPVSVWTITQLNAPERGYILLRENGKIPGGFTKPPHDSPNSPYPFDKVSVSGRLLSFTRDPKVKRKLGSDGDRLLWLGRTQSLLIEQNSNASPNAEFPDGGLHSQVYTNPDELPYVELELFSALKTMKPGDTTSLEATYSLYPRKLNDDDVEASRILGLK
jgi:hypothetical protein